MNFWLQWLALIYGHRWMQKLRPSTSILPPRFKLGNPEMYLLL